MKRYSHKDFHVNVHRSIIYNSQQNRNNPNSQVFNTETKTGILVQLNIMCKQMRYWMKYFKIINLCKRNQTQRLQVIWFQLYERPRKGKSVEAKVDWCLPGVKGGNGD